MLKFRPSIRQKITLGYYAIVVIIVGLSIFTFLELRFVEKKIMFGAAISDFFDTTLEIRRFEKNYFLYAKEIDYQENIRYVARAQEILQGNIPGFNTIVLPQHVDSIKTNLTSYRDLMGQYAEGKDRGQHFPGLEENIRKTGKEIITMSEDISRMERKNLQLLLARYQKILIISIITLSTLAIVIGQILSRMVVRPLQSLEESMGVIAEGKFERVAIDSKDREIVSLTNAFNKMLKELELHERHLIQSEKLASLGTLLSGVAHELNNPLSNISSSSQILAEEIEEPDTAYKKELVSQINEQTDRARNIVRSLLEFSRDKEFKKERLPLKKILEETIQFVKGQVPTKIAINLSVPDDIIIFADKQRIQQAFLNLIKNAIESISTDEGMVSITAKKRRAADKGEEDITGIYNYLKFRGKCTIEDDTIDIEVRDTGSGIQPELLPKIFDPFFTTKDVGKGSGLGLFIVYEIIEEHDGCIAVDSEIGKGTTFFIKLPMKE
ncbi:MAG TPA: HAMP domain-containing sensor histidine kinase [Nitrospirota bacterium]|nr:HAMP domain-containing sensor histidine kinase [Nitrospirota bacterium]